MKTDKEVQDYFHETAFFSFNGVLDDFVFGRDSEWYCLLVDKGINRQPEPYAGPFVSYEFANACEFAHRDGIKQHITGYIYTK